MAMEYNTKSVALGAGGRLTTREGMPCGAATLLCRSGTEAALDSLLMKVSL